MTEHEPEPEGEHEHVEAPTGADLVREAASETPAHVKASLGWAIVPSFILGLAAVLDAQVAPLHSLATALVGVVNGALLGVYMRFAMRAAGGVPHSGFGTPVVTMMLASLGLEHGDWALVAPVLAFVLPAMDYAVMYGEGPDGALGGVLDTLKTAPGVWLTTMLGLLVSLVMLFFVFGLPMSIFSTYAHREGAWLANLMGGVLVGPVLHVAIVFRARLFLLIHGDPA